MRNPEVGPDAHDGHVIGVDIGGTFTDAVAVDSAGRVTLGKAASTPPNFEVGFLESIRALSEELGTTLEGIVGQARGIYHGCTVATNALVEGQTARVGLITTRGHRDSILIMQAGGRNRGMPPEYVARPARHRPPPLLIPLELVEEVDERIAFDGNVVVALNEESCRAAIARLIAAGVEAIAVSLLWSVVNPSHELEVARLIREQDPDAFVSLSSNVVPRTGEYQRTVATVMNALVGPRMDAYLRALTEHLRDIGYESALWVMSCSGGVVDARHARELPLLTIGSGPVAGLIGAGALARAGDRDGRSPTRANIITADMGGTTLDIGVVRNGQPLNRATSRHGQYEYFVPTLDVRSVGSGGGSIVRYDPHTMSLRVGPESAGAVPGPAAYMRGGTEATVTDSDLALGYLNPDHFLGGKLPLSLEAAFEALGRAGAELGFGAQETAAAAVRIVENEMADAIRLTSVEQGYDPRQATMYTYGGGGPVHATAIARLLGIPRVIVPLSDLAAGWSAFGAASADAVIVEELPKTMKFPFAPDELDAGWKVLEDKVERFMAAQSIPAASVISTRSVDIRYAIQVNQVEVVAAAGATDEAAALSLVSAFESEYQRLFGEGTGYADAGFVLTTMRIRARASLLSVDLAAHRERNEQGASAALKGDRDVVFYQEGPSPVRTPVYAGEKLGVGARVDGPAIVEFPQTTLVVRQDERATVDQLGSLVVEL